MTTAAVRRVVTGITPEGESAVLDDSPVTALDLAVPGFELLSLWHTNAGVSVPGSERSAAVIEGDPKPGETTCLYWVFPPGDAPRDMHSAAAVDTVYVVSGEICLRLGGGEDVALGAGDCVVQQGATHTWTNRSDSSAALLIFRVGAEHHDQ